MASTHAPQSFSQLRNTPPIQPSVVESGYLSGDLQKSRAAVLKDLKRYLELPFSTFIDSIFGSPSTAECSRMRKALVDDGTLNIGSDGEAHWASFDTPPHKSHDPENVAFNPFCDIIKHIFAHIPNCQVSLDASPNKKPVSPRKNPTRPDACILLGVPAQIHWFDIVAPFEFKKASGSRAANDNIVKTIWSLHEIMREDPLRRFVFGFTVEDTKMKVWYSNRAYLVASLPIDIMEDVDNVVSLFHSIGSKRDDELGWDDTASRINHQGEIQYKFKVHNQFFTTTCPLATHGADSIVGRGVRVYEAKDENGNIVVVKDSWREESREKEGAILQQIFGDIRKGLGAEEAEEAEKYIVKVQSFEDVSGGNDVTFKFSPSIKKGLSWITIDPAIMYSLGTSSTQSPSEGHIPSSTSSGFQTHQTLVKDDDHIPCRVHTRAIFEEVGMTLKSIDDLVCSLDCLSGAQKALGYLHQVGWVHCDISVSNILQVVKDGGYIGKLTDFEYAKKVNSLGSHEVRTGTRDFMALEVEYGHHIFLPTSVLKRPPFQMNPLHDLESLWWCTIWILLHHTDMHSPAEDLNAQRVSLQKAFPNQPAPSRHYFLQLPVEHEIARNTLSKTYADKCIPIFDLADILHQNYQDLEKDNPVLTPFSFPGDKLVNLHTQVSNAYRQVIDELKGSGDVRVKLHSLPDLIEAKQMAPPEGSGSNQPVKKKQRLV